MARRVDLTGVRRSGLNDYGGAGVSGGNQQSLSNSSQINFDQIKVEKGGGDNPLILDLCPKPSFQCEEIFIPGWRTLFPDLGSRPDQVRNYIFLILNDHGG